jgi:transcriptional regulator with XRE-family HTH domain/Zn-dependent peptidase ImmA (M78 family)
MCENRTMSDQLDWLNIGARLRQSRIAAGFSQEQLAQAIGLERTMVAKVEAGSRRLDALELSRVAAVLGLPMAHFLTRPPEVLSRRTELSEDANADAARNAYLLEAELATWLRDIRQLIGLRVLDHARPVRYPGAVTDGTSARDAATWLRGELGVGNRPLGPLVQVCEAVGQLLLVTDVPGEGASVLDDDLAVSVVSSRSEPGRRRSTAAHELGHLVIGDEYSADLGVHTSREDRERAVDAFAAELLLPAAALREAVPVSALEDTRTALVRLAAVYRTSWSLVLRQAEQTRVIDQRQLFASRVPTRAELMDAAGWAPEPDLEQLRVSPSVAAAVMNAWRQGLITPRRAEELTRGQISADDLLFADDTSGKP